MKKTKKIKDVGPTARLISPEAVAKALGAEEADEKTIRKYMKYPRKFPLESLLSGEDKGMQTYDDRPEVISLFKNIRSSMDELEALLEQCNSYWAYEDMIYRFYHHSFKVYDIQHLTGKITSALRALNPDIALSETFMQIINDGTGKRWKMKDNDRWLKVTRPMLEAFFHSRYFLEMAIEYGKTMDQPPTVMPSGWAALLALYNLR